MAGFFGFFDYSKPGRGISKDEPEKTGIALYFDILLRRFWKLISLNLLYILFSIPAIVIFGLFSSLSVTYISSYVFDLAHISADESAALYFLTTRLTVILFTVFGSGAATAGMTYVLRNYVNDKHSWVWSDFFDNFKSNFKQGTIVFLIDIVAIVLFSVSWFFYSSQVSAVMMSVVLRAIVLGVFVIFTMMHMYIYHIMVTFKLGIKDIYRNSFILIMARLPWNVLAFLFECAIIYAGIYASMVSGIGMIVICLIMMTLVCFTGLFMTNKTVRRYMLEPALANEGKTETTEEEAVFEDVTRPRG